MTTHTPGPWDWFTNGSRTYLATPNRGRLYVMGFARQGMQGAGPRFAHWDRMEAGAPRERLGGIMEDGPYLRDGTLHPDARLIAVAPELLEALRRAALALAFAAETSPAMRDDYEAVSAAIAKATGVQP